MNATTLLHGGNFSRSAVKFMDTPSTMAALADDGILGLGIRTPTRETCRISPKSLNCGIRVDYLWYR
jgi:hypothetical protein